MNQFAPNLASLCPETRRFWEFQNSEKSVLGLSPGEGGFCSTETKHDRRTAPRPKLFVSTKRLQEQRSQPQKSVLGSSPGKMVSVARIMSAIEGVEGNFTSIPNYM
jgi:hypothetical protein